MVQPVTFGSESRCLENVHQRHEQHVNMSTEKMKRGPQKSHITQLSYFVLCRILNSTTKLFNRAIFFFPIFTHNARTHAHFHTHCIYTCTLFIAAGMKYHLQFDRIEPRLRYIFPSIFQFSTSRPHPCGHCVVSSPHPHTPPH